MSVLTMHAALFRLLPLAGLLAGCAENLVPPATATKLSDGVELRAFPPALHLVVDASHAPFVAAFNANERVQDIPLEGHATIKENAIARLDGGTVVALAPGEAKLHVESTLGAIDVPIVVHASEPTALALEPIAPTRIGSKAAVKATLTWAEGTSDATYDVTFSTDEPARLHVPETLDARGWVALLDDRPAKLRARLGELEAITVVRAIGRPPMGIEIRLAWSFLNLRRFGAFARYEDGEVQEVSGACLWETGSKPWRAAVAGAPLGPLLRADQVAWDRTATCTIAGARGSGSLFSP